MFKYTSMLIGILTLASFQSFSAISDDSQIFLHALSQVESSGGKQRYNKSEGAYGKYQIRKLYFIDAQAFNPILKKYQHSDCLNNDWLSEQVVRAYARKYEPEASRRKDWEIISKLHNGGPNWRNKGEIVKARLEVYWGKIRVAMMQGK